MCGYCVEGHIIGQLLNVYLHKQALPEQLEDYQRPIFEVLFVSELADNHPVFTPCLALLKPDHPLSLWLALHQRHRRSHQPEVLSAGLLRFLRDESRHYQSLLGRQLPTFTQFATDATFAEKSIQQCCPVKHELISQAKYIVREVSASFAQPALLPPDDARHENMAGLIFSGDQSEHPAFSQLPNTLMLAADILLRYEPNAAELFYIALHHYPTPAEDSLMMAWQRYVVWQLVILHGDVFLSTYGAYLRRELVIYIMGRQVFNGTSTSWTACTKNMMKSIEVNFTHDQFTELVDVIDKASA